jgi:hypothetical protein
MLESIKKYLLKKCLGWVRYEVLSLVETQAFQMQLKVLKTRIDTEKLVKALDAVLPG